MRLLIFKTLNFSKRQEARAERKRKTKNRASWLKHDSFASFYTYRCAIGVRYAPPKFPCSPPNPKFGFTNPGLEHNTARGAIATAVVLGF